VTKLDHALAWAARGFRVFPCKVNSRATAIGAWWEVATTDPDTIRSWWRNQISGEIYDFNIGVDTTGFGVVDVDTKHGAHAVQNFYAIGGHFDTLVVQSQSGGYHVYYATSRPLANSQGSLIKDVDVRGHHGLVLAPGSTIDGNEYKLLVDLPIAQMPEQLERRCKSPGERATEEFAVEELDTLSMITTAAEYLGRVRPALEGQGGDNHTFQVAAHARELGVSEEKCLELMLEHFNERCEPPWEYDALAAKIRNAYAYAENQPGSHSAEAVFGSIARDAFTFDSGQISEKHLLVEYVVDFPPQGSVSHFSEGKKPRIAFGNMILPANLERRPWIYSGLLERGEVTLFVAPGGAGKSLFILNTALRLALGQEIYGFRNLAGRVGSVIYNAEDSLQEMSGRLLAHCILHGIDYRDVSPYIMLISGKDHGKLFNIRTQNGTPVMDGKSLDTLVNICSGPGIGFLALDPLSRLHDCNENDNVQMTGVIDAVVHVAHLTGVAVALPHHMAKPPMAGFLGYAGNAYAARGAGAIVEACRVAVTLSAPTDEDMKSLGIPPGERQRLVRLDDAKLNRGLMRGEPVWIRKETVVLPNGEETGAFGPADVGGYVARARTDLGVALYAEMTSAVHRSSLSIADAAMLLMRYDPAWGKQQPAVVRQRVEMMLSERIILSDGSALELMIDAKGKSVVLK
jgi:AAA domain/Bifunctional DNA primase/polymerase, N-terminal